MSRLFDGAPFARAGAAAIAALVLTCTSAIKADADPQARFRGTGKADPVRIVNVRRADGPVAGQSSVTFDLAWDHSWRAAWDVSKDQHGGTGTLKIESWDAAWLFVKFCGGGARAYTHATLSTNASDHSVPAGAKLDIGPSGVGVFVYRNAPGHGANDWKGVTLRWLHKADGVDDPGAVGLKVFAIQMVYVPQCAFWAGDGSTTNVAGQFSAGDTTKPFRITSEDAITLGGQSKKNLGNRDGFGMLRAEDFTSRRTRTLPAKFPKGYTAFYCMKHEITQGQYVTFLNSLRFEQQARMTSEGRRYAPYDKSRQRLGKPDAAAGTRLQRELGGHGRKENLPGEGPGRNGLKIAVPGRPAMPAVYGTDTPHVACPTMMWSDCVAYAAWAGLRPMTELEYEKASRGPIKPVPNEYAWGTNRIAGTNWPKLPRDGYAIKNPGRADEHVVWEGSNGPFDSAQGKPDATRGNAAWWGAVEQGTGSFAIHAINGPLRVGIFATPRSGRVAAGASYWGIMELTGNLWERMVTVGYQGGRRFAGTHGNGSLAQPAGWQFSDGHEFGLRGGGSGWWYDHNGTLRTSDRWNMHRGILIPRIRMHQFNYGFRCARTAP